MIVHCKHDGCYENCVSIDNKNNAQITQITINLPKVFLFNNKEDADIFFNGYINDVDVIDTRCKKGDDVVHCDVCTCGIIDFDKNGNTVLFYNKTNQIFLLENSAQTFTTHANMYYDSHNMNLSNKLLSRGCKKLSVEQKIKYIKLGKMCEENT
jgi:hypothetical protein